MSDTYEHAFAESIIRRYYALRNNGHRPTAIKLHPGELAKMRKFLEFEHVIGDDLAEDRILGMRIIETTDTIEPNDRIIV